MQRIVHDLGIRAILALLMVLSLIIMIFMKVEIPEGFVTLVTAIVTYYFSNRSTLDKPEDRNP